MATSVNSSPQFAADRLNYIEKKVLPLARRQLVAYQFGDPLRLPKGYGVTYTGTRFNRLPLPYAPLSEGVPPVGETMTVTQVSATAQQWGDKVTITDVAEITIYHPLFKQAIDLTALQIGETLERNTYNNLMGGTQVNYVNSRGARVNLQAGDVLDPHTVNRTVVSLKAVGAPRFMADEQTDTKIDAGEGQPRASSNPRQNPHYVAISSPEVLGDFSENSTVVTAWSYSDINRLYNEEVGEWRGIRFCESNMVPSWTGFGQTTGTGVTAGGSLAAANYFVEITGQDTQNQFESYIESVSASVSVGGSGAGSITLTTPNSPGFTFNVYIGTSTAVQSLGLSPQGPTTGPLQGVATQLPANTTVTITGTGPQQVPPAYPGNTTGLTVWPTFVFGRGAYGQVVLDDVKMTYLTDADKSDPNNQLRVVGWKAFYGTLLENVQFMARIESTSAFTGTFG